MSISLSALQVWFDQAGNHDLFSKPSFFSSATYQAFAHFIICPGDKILTIACDLMVHSSFVKHQTILHIDKT
jgi:hypothetical protein